MKYFILKLTLFATIVIALTFSVELFLPYYYGSQPFIDKSNSFSSERMKGVNTVFFGSSRIYRQIIPTEFDSICNYKVKSYNFATAGARNPESYFLYENFINSQKAEKIKYAFVELLIIDPLKGENVKAIRGNYWNSISTTKYCLNYIDEAKYANEFKNELKFNYKKSLFYRYFNFKKLIYFGKNLHGKKAKDDANFGFVSLDSEMYNEKVKGEFTERFEFYKKDTSDLKDKIKAAVVLEDLEIENYLLNKTHYNKLMKLIELSKTKGIHLIFIVPPKLVDYTELVPIMAKLPKENIISVASYVEYSSLYYDINTFDNAHLSVNGSKIFTEAIAKKFNQIKPY